jgi:nitric oxide reductase subunit C
VTLVRDRRRASAGSLLLLTAAAVLTAFLLHSRHPAGQAGAAAGGGDPARGARLFATLPCASCHDVAHPWPGGDICPNLGNIATEAGRILAQPDYYGRARNPAGYIRESILDPNAYIVAGPGYRQADGQSVMPKDFGQTLRPADVDDLVAFLLTRR